MHFHAEAFTMRSLMMMTSIVFKESLAKDKTQTDTHGLIYVNFFMKTKKKLTSITTLSLNST